MRGLRLDHDPQRRLLQLRQLRRDERLRVDTMDTPQPDPTDPTEPTDPSEQFGYHVCAVCAIGMLTLSLGAATPEKPAGPLALLCAAGIIRWSRIEHRRGKSAGPISSIVVDVGIGLMAADIIAFWT